MIWMWGGGCSQAFENYGDSLWPQPLHINNRKNLKSSVAISSSAGKFQQVPHMTQDSSVALDESLGFSDPDKLGSSGMLQVQTSSCSTVEGHEEL